MTKVAEVRKTSAASPAPRPHKGFRADIQALRALAVSAVVLNHLWPGILPGGYVGVDVFFVISGFLITRHLMDELHRNGRIRFAAFYARRMKRLLPAALLVALASLVVSWLILPFARWVDIAWETFAAAFYGENWLLAAKSIDYSANHENATPVQHYWSLSVEEQFYLVWPLLLAGVFFLAIRLRVTRLGLATGMVAFVATLSLIFSIVYTKSNPNEAYFVTTTRAWEFGVGALVALGSYRLSGRGSRSLQVLAPGAVRGSMAALGGLGLLAVILCAFLFNAQTPFPGSLALIPVLGTAAVVLSGSVLGTSAIPGLQWRPLQFLGDVSYSLYLWHWPLIVLVPAVLGHELGVISALGVLMASLVLAWLSKKFVEDPARSNWFAGPRQYPALLSGFGAMALVGMLSLLMVFHSGINSQQQKDALAQLAHEPCYGAAALDADANCQDPFGPPRAQNIGKEESPYVSVPGCGKPANPLVVQGATLLHDCDYSGGDPNAKQVWFIGDSHAEHWKGPFFTIARAQKWHVYMSLAGGCSLADVKRISFFDEPRLDAKSQNKCLDWSQKLSERIIKAKPDAVVASAFSSKEGIDDGTGRDQLAQYRDSMQRRLKPWVDNGSKVIVIRDVPLTLNISSPGCVTRNEGDVTECATDRARSLVADPMAAAVTSMNVPGMSVVDLSDKFCDEKKCHAVVGGLYAYYDNNHMARSFADTLAPTLSERILADLARNQGS